jgi:esterase/lipase
MGELPSRRSFLGTLGSTAHGSLFMEGDSHKPTFLFIHGFATYVDDLIPLALAFNQDGYSCDLLALEGHGGSFEDLRDTGYERWYEQVSHAYTFRKEKGGKVFIVGFSLGALLAMDYARDHSVDGIIGISTFMGPRGPTAA